MSASESGQMLIYALITGTASVGTLACGIGILMLKNWARRLTLAGIWLPTVWQIAVTSFMVMKAIPEQWPSLVAIIAITTGWAGLVSWYFLRPSVKAQFVSKTTNR